MKVVEVIDLGDDRLEVRGVSASGEEAIGHGWCSAMTNHFSPKSYEASGHLKASAESREMTQKEKMAYWLSLLPPEEEPSTPTVLFSAD